MGGGNYNGKNYSGLHTGADKNQNSGPYSNDGYRVNPNLSHLSFLVDDEVIYIGQSKNKHKSYIPNGTKGIVVQKPKSTKSSRSTLLVNFGEYGKRYVSKSVLQFTSDYSDYIDSLKNKLGRNQGYQSYRNNNRGNRITKESMIEKTLENRKKNKEFRNWRKQFLDFKKNDIIDYINSQQNSEDVIKRKNLLKEKKTEYDKLYELYSPVNLSKTKSEFIKENSKENDYETCEKKFSSLYEKTLLELKQLKLTIYNLKEKIKQDSDNIKELIQLVEGNSRQYFYDISNKTDYNKMLYSQYENRKLGENGFYEKPDFTYKNKDSEPSRNYIINSDVKINPEDNLKLIQWGLYPKDVLY